MKSKKAEFETIDDYIANYPPEVQHILQELRATIKAAAPDATEVISYQMPAFKLKGNLVYFAVWKKHIGFYPASDAVLDIFKEELSHYKGTSGSIHLPLDQPLPLKLIHDIVEVRVIEDLKHAETKAKAKAKKKKST